MQHLTRKRWLLDFVRIRGVHIRLHASCLLLAGWFILDPGFSLGIAYTSVLLLAICFSLALHGAAHLVVATRSLASAEELIVHPLGAHIRYAKPLPPLQSLRVAMAGPLTSIMLAAILWPFASQSIVPVSFFDLSLYFTPLYLEPSISLIDRIFAVNLTIAFVNCLPIAPLDGNVIIRDILRIQKVDNAESNATRLGQLASAAIIFFASLEGNYFIVSLGLLAMASSTRAFLQARSSALAKDYLAKDLVSESTRPRAFLHNTALRDAALEAVKLPDDLFAITDGRILLGYVSKSALLHHAASRSEPCAISEIAVRVFYGVPPETSLEKLLPQMQSREVPSPVLVVEDERLLGFLTVSKIVEFLLLQECFEQDLEREDDLYDF